jgi:hypothetical protein
MAASKPAFEAQYAASPGSPELAASEEIAMIRPLPDDRR